MSVTYWLKPPPVLGRPGTTGGMTGTVPRSTFTAQTALVPALVTVHFDKGRPTRVVNKADGTDISGRPLALFEYLNKIGGAHGVGRSDVVENRARAGARARRCGRARALTRGGSRSLRSWRWAA